MPSQVNSSSSASSTSLGGRSWTNPSNALTSDNSYASSTTPTGISDTTDGLDLVGCHFSVPSNAVVNGVQVDIECNTNNDAHTHTVQLLLSGTASGSNLSDSAAWSNAGDTTLTYGSSSTLWGLSLTYADVNDGNFGVRVRATLPTIGTTANVDEITVTVYYTVTYLLTVGSGSYALTGATVALKRTTIFSVGGGSYSLTGSSVSLVHGHPITVSAGSYALSGSVVNLVAPARLTVTAGAYTLTGNTVAVKWGHKLVIGAGSYTLTGSPTVITFDGAGLGASGIQMSVDTASLGNGRVANDIAGYNVYIGEDALPTYTTPTQFSQTLPVTIAATPPVSGTKVLNVVVRAQDKYGLESNNQYPTLFTIDSTGALVRNDLSSPKGLGLMERAGGYVRVLCTYPAFNDETDPPTHWKVWGGLTPPDVVIDLPLVTLAADKILFTTVGPFAAGTVTVKVAAYRNFDGKLSPVLVGTVEMTAAPSQPQAVHSGLDEG